MNLGNGIPAAAALLLAAGCKVGPDYERPEIAVPPAWRETTSTTLPARAADLSSWWSHLGDPVLDGLVERATRQGLDLREALARVSEALALRGAVAADLYPTLDANASYTYFGESENTPFGEFVPDWNRYGASLDTAWEIDLWGRVRRAIQASDADLEAIVEDARDVAVTAAAETAISYFQFRAFQRRLEISLDQLALQEETLALVRARFDAGLVRERDVAQAATQVETTRARIPALEFGLRAAENRLAVLLGLPPGALAEELAPPAPIPVPPPEVAVGVPADLLRRRADVRRAERALAAEHARIGVAEGDLYPRLTLLGNLGLAADKPRDFFETGSTFFGVGPSIRWNLFDAGRLRDLVHASEARAEQALIRWERAVLLALEEGENAMTLFLREQARRRALLEAVAHARLAADLAQRQYADGLSDFQPVLDSQRTHSDLEDDVARSEAAVAATLVALYRARGGGWESMAGLGAAAARG